MNKIKVLMINTVQTSRSGITSVICNLIANLDDREVQVDVVSINEPDKIIRNTIEQGERRLFVLPRYRKKIISYFINLIRLIKTNNYEIVHIHGNSHTITLELLAAKIAGCKNRIAHSHNTTCNARVLNMLLTIPFHILCTYCIACGDEAGRWMFGKRKFIVIKNAIKTDQYSFNEYYRKLLRKEMDADENKIIICHVGRFNDQKNQSFLIDVYSCLLHRTNKSYALLFIGDGKRLNEVEEKARRMNINTDVTFLGAIDNVSQYLSACDLVVMPSFYEGLPLTLIEEQANGLQCIVSDVITKEVDITGTLVYVSLEKKADEWAEIIDTIPLVNNRVLQSENNIRKIEKAGYSIENEALFLKNTYEELIRR